MTEIFVRQSETLHKHDVSVCTKAFFARTICFYQKLFLKNPELLIINEFPQINTPASYTQKHTHLKHTYNLICICDDYKVLPYLHLGNDL